MNTGRVRIGQRSLETRILLRELPIPTQPSRMPADFASVEQCDRSPLFSSLSFRLDKSGHEHVPEFRELHPGTSGLWIARHAWHPAPGIARKPLNTRPPYLPNEIISTDAVDKHRIAATVDFGLQSRLVCERELPRGFLRSRAVRRVDAGRMNNHAEISWRVALGWMIELVRRARTWGIKSPAPPGNPFHSSPEQINNAFGPYYRGICNPRAGVSISLALQIIQPLAKHSILSPELPT